MTLYYKGAVNTEGLLSIVDPMGYKTMGAAVFTVDEAANLELMDCRPVILGIARAYMTRHDVVATEAPGGAP